MTKKAANPVDYVARARDYLSKDEGREGEPADSGMNEKQLDILGRIVSLNARPGIIAGVLPYEWICPWETNEEYPEPYLAFTIPLNPKIRKKGAKRIQQDLKNLTERLGLPTDCLTREIEEPGNYQYWFDFEKEGIKWSALFMLKDLIKN